MPLTEANPDAIAKVYAKSLFELCEQAGGRDKAEETLGELEDILEIARENPTFSEFLATRVIPVESREKSLVSIFEGKASDLTLRFLRLLNRKGRLGHLPPIVASFESLVHDAFGRVEVDLYTADALDVLTQVLAAGKSARLYRALTDPGLSTSAAAYFPRLRDPGLFIAYATLAPDVAHETAEAALKDALQAIATEGISDGELARARRQVVADEAGDCIRWDVFLGVHTVLPLTGP